MNNRASKKILSFALALAMMFTLLPMVTVQAADVGIQLTETQAAVELPSLEGQKLPPAPPSLAINAGEQKAVTDNDSSTGDKIDYMPPLKEGASPGGRNGIDTSQATITLKIEDNHTTGYTVNKNFTKVATGSNVIVYCETWYIDRFGDNSTAANVVRDKADAILSQFDFLGNVYWQSGETEKVKIVLSDLDAQYDQNNNSGSYVAGYFDPNDFFPGSNGDKILYIDIGEYTDGNYIWGGYATYQRNPDSFFSTVAHEYQHMVNFSQWYPKRYITNSLQYESDDPEGTSQVAKWLNEGLSGLVDILYTDEINSGHLQYFMAGYNGSGYVPTRSQWGSGNALADYGSTALLMSEFYQYKDKTGVVAVIDDLYTGWNGSLQNVGDKYAGGHTVANFDAFVRTAMLDIMVDTPDGTDSDVTAAGGYVYRNIHVPNVWKERAGLTGAEFAGVTSIAPKTSYSVSAHGKKYYSELYLADSIGANSTVTIRVPDDGAEYYAIIPIARTSINDTNSWVDAPKTAVVLNSTTPTTLKAGTDNRFAILRVNYGSIPRSGSFSYTVGPDSTPPTVSSITPANGETGVEINGNIVITFDEPIGTTGTVSLDNGIGTLTGGSWSTTNMGNYTFIISYSGLSYSTTYNVTISGFKDGAGNAMETAHTSDFTTKAQPTDPDVSPTTLNLDLNGNPNGILTISLGQSGNQAAGADITVDPANAGDISVDTNSLTADGTVTVTGHRVVTGAALTIGFSGGDLATSTSVPVTVNVSDSTPQPIYHTVTFNLAGGTHTGGGALVQSVPDGGAATAPTTTRTGYTFTGWDKSFSNVTADMTVTARWTYNSSSSSSRDSDSGSSGSGGSTTATTTATPNAPSDVSQSQAIDAAVKAAAAAKASGGTIATVNMKNVGNISLAALQAMAKAAGMPVKFQADSMSADGKAVEVRITLDPGKSTKGLNLSASTSNAGAKASEAMFEKWFRNNVSVVSFAQQGDFGQPVDIAAKVDLTGMDTSNLYFYSYDKATNTYRRIEKPAYWIDKNGYLRFTTELAGDIVITEGALERK